MDDLTPLPLHAVALWLTLESGRIFPIAGVSARALVLALIARSDPTLAQQLQTHTAARPYTVAMLHEDRTPTQVAIRVTAVGSAIPRALAAAVAQAGEGPPLRLGPQAVAGIELTTSPLRTPWVDMTTLSAAQRSAAMFDDTITFVLASPLLPRARPADWSDGPPARAVLSPAMLFGALRERWLALGPQEHVPSADMVWVAASRAELLDGQLAISTHLRRSGPPREELRGFTGRMTVRLRGGMDERLLLRRLAALGFFLGAGVGTATGMGRIRAMAGGQLAALPWLVERSL